MLQGSGTAASRDRLNKTRSLFGLGYEFDWRSFSFVISCNEPSSSSDCVKEAH